MATKQILIFGKEGCAKCMTTKNKVGHYINKWGLDGEVPVIFLDMDKAEGLSEGAFRDVSKVPTTIIEDQDQMVARWDGEVPNSERLRSMLGA